MTGLAHLPSTRLDPPADFAAAVQPDDLVYFCCNVGDADAQLLLLPGATPSEPRRAIVVDAGISGKVERLLAVCAESGLLPRDPQTGDLADDAIALVVATHPHADHIRGLPGLLRRYGNQTVELWDSGYWHPIRAFHEVMAEVERLPHLVYAQPTAGTRRWIQTTRITVLAPAIQLKNRYDSYGVEINDASLALRVDYPAARVLRRNAERELIDRERPVGLVLGGDAQTASWSFVATDFPQLHADDNAAARAIRAATGADHLSADVLKVAHHASKRGINLELVERINPAITLVSCADHSPAYNFPHQLAQELLREAIQRTAGTGEGRADDCDLGIFYTADTDDAGAELGTVALRLRPNRREVWRLGDAAGDVAFDLSQARRWRP